MTVGFRPELGVRRSVSEKRHFVVFLDFKFWLLIYEEDEILSSLDSRKSRFGVREQLKLGSRGAVLIRNEFGAEEAVVL